MTAYIYVQSIYKEIQHVESIEQHSPIEIQGT